MVFAPLTRRKHSLRTEALSGARVSAPALSSAIFFHLWLVLSPLQQSNSGKLVGRYPLQRGYAVDGQFDRQTAVEFSANLTCFAHEKHKLRAILQCFRVDITRSRRAPHCAPENPINMQDSETFVHAATRAIAWAAILGAVAAFWTGVGLALIAWVR